MKYVFACVLLLSITSGIRAQLTTSVVYVTKTYSQNGRFYIKCIPYDNEDPSLRGKSLVYDRDDKLQYTINRGFPWLRECGNFLSISNDGKTVLYAIEVYANENTDGLKSISIYKNAALVKSFTLSQVTGIDTQNERGLLIYSNYDEVVDLLKSNNDPVNYKKTFKDGITGEDKFLSDYPVFCYNDTVFLTDSKKITHVIDLKSAGIVSNVNFEDIYPRIKKYQITHAMDAKVFDAPYAPDKSFFPNLANGDTTGFELGKAIGMKAMRLDDPGYFKYKTYLLEIGAYISKNGKIEIVALKADKHLPVEKIRSFFTGHIFDVSFLPAEIDKWYFHDFFWGFRNSSDEQALLEKRQEEKQKQLEREKKLTLDSINNVYIPKNLEDCFVQLDKKLPIISKNEMRALKNKSDMMAYHFSLGMWMRNNWGLWGGSRLWLYFSNRGFSEPDGISGIILDNYYDWLHEKKDAWKEFETKYPAKK